MAHNNTETDYLLTCLMEEAAEVIQAAAKCIRFGFRNGYPGHVWNNEKLAQEIGDLLGIVAMLPLDNKIIHEWCLTKATRIAASKQVVPTKPGETL